MRRNTENDFWKRIRRDAPGSCWPWLGRSVDKDGYGLIKFRSEHLRTHRLAWCLTFGVIPDDLHVLHTCDNPPCCNPNHLFLGTELDNARDRQAKGRGNKSRGENHSRAKLTALSVGLIKWRLLCGESQVSIADCFGVTGSNIWCIAHNVSWADISPAF